MSGGLNRPTRRWLPSRGRRPVTRSPPRVTAAATLGRGVPSPASAAPGGAPATAPASHAPGPPSAPYLQPASRARSAPAPAPASASSATRPKGPGVMMVSACTTGDVCDGNGRCVGTPDDALCLSGETCTNGECLCASGNEVCGAACVSGCCNKGVEEDCAGGQTCCSGHGCRDLQTDKDHCGKCGASCVPDTFTVCESGQCKCGTNPACTGGKICNPANGECVCPNGGTSCEGTCEGDKVWCGDQCLVCPPPPPGIGLPGEPPPGTCCEELSECSCGGGCCKSKDDCFQTFDRSTNEVVNEFCCTEEGGTVCGDQCCKTSDCASGCIRLFPVGGSYRRPGR